MLAKGVHYDEAVGLVQRFMQQNVDPNTNAHDAEHFYVKRPDLAIRGIRIQLDIESSGSDDGCGVVSAKGKKIA